MSFIHGGDVVIMQRFAGAIAELRDRFTRPTPGADPDKNDELLPSPVDALLMIVTGLKDAIKAAYQAFLDTVRSAMQLASGAVGMFTNG